MRVFFVPARGAKCLVVFRGQEYHRAATELKLIPSSAKHADGISYEIPVASRGNGVEQVPLLPPRLHPRPETLHLSPQPLVLSP